MAKAIGTLGNIDSITVAGRVFTDLTNLITLIGGVASVNRRCTFRAPAATSGYAVTTAKTLRIYAGAFSCAAAAGNNGLLGEFGYGDNDIGIDSATSITTPVYMGGDVLASAVGSLTSASQPGQYQYLLHLPVPASKYVFMKAISVTLTGLIYGYET